MTIHLGWDTVLWVLAGIGALRVLWFLFGALMMFLFFHD